MQILARQTKSRACIPYKCSTSQPLFDPEGGGGAVTPYSSLYREAPPERVNFLPNSGFRHMRG